VDERLRSEKVAAAPLIVRLMAGNGPPGASEHRP